MNTSGLSRRTMLKMMGLAAVGTLAACAPAGIQPAPGSGEAGAESAGDAAVEVSLWQHSYPPLNTAYEQLIAEFQEANPNIKVLFDTAAAPEFEQKLLTAMAAGSGPDIFRMPSWSTATYVSKGLVKPLIPEQLGMGSHQELMDEYAPASSVDGWVEDGELYAIPIEISVMCTWYRLDILQEELGIGADELPATWDELWAIAAELTQKDDSGATTRIGFSWPLTNAIWMMHHYSPILYQQGGSFLTEDGQACALLDSPAALEALNILTEVYERGGADPDFSVPQALDTGKQVIEFSGPFRPSNLKLNNPDLEYGVNFIEGNWPQTEGGIPTAYMWGPASLTPNPNTEHVEETYKLIQHLWDRPEVFWEVANIMSTRRIFMESDAFKNSPWLPTFMEDAQIARPAVKSVVYEEIKTTNHQMIQRVVLEGVSAEESLALACEDINNAISR